MCRVLKVARSGFYAWLKDPLSERAKEDAKLTEEIQHFFKESQQTYGSPRIHIDMLEAGHRISRKRVERLMKNAGLYAVRSYKKRRGNYPRPSHLAPNLLEQDFNVEAPDKRWVTDITQVQTGEGWLYLAVVEDLFSRAIVGWSMQSHLRKELVLDALLSAMWRRQPKGKVIIHSDQGAQYGSDAWQRFCKDHNLEMSMSGRGNCYDNAAMESFNSTLKKERVRGRIYTTRNEARADIFDYIECFYNQRRRHSYLGYVSPNEFEKQAILVG